MSPNLHSQKWKQDEKKKSSAIAGPGGCHCRLHFPAAFSEENALSKRRHWSNVRRTKTGIRKPRRRERSADRKAKRFTLLFTYILTQITPETPIYTAFNTPISVLGDDNMVRLHTPQFLAEIMGWIMSPFHTDPTLIP